MYYDHSDPQDKVGPEQGYTISTFNSKYETSRRMNNTNPYVDSTSSINQTAMASIPDRTPVFASTQHQPLTENIYPAALGAINNIGTHGVHPLDSGEYEFMGVSKAATEEGAVAGLWSYGTANIRTTVTEAIPALTDFAWDFDKPRTLKGGMLTAGVTPMRLLEPELSMRQAKRIANAKKTEFHYKPFHDILVALIQAGGATISPAEIAANLASAKGLDALQASLLMYSVCRRKRLARRGGKALRNYPGEQNTDTFYVQLDQAH